MSAWTPSASAPRWRNSFAASSTASASRAAMTILAPASANASAIARPKPLEPPVTRTTFSFQNCMIRSGRACCRTQPNETTASAGSPSIPGHSKRSHRAVHPFRGGHDSRRRVAMQVSPASSHDCRFPRRASAFLSKPCREAMLRTYSDAGNRSQRWARFRARSA